MHSPAERHAGSHDGDHGRPRLIFDGDCAFCSSCARFVVARSGGKQTALAWQHLGADEVSQLGLTLNDVETAAWWIDAAGRPYGGHLAVAHALVRTAGWTSTVGRLLLLPPVRLLAAPGYRGVVRFRHRLPGGTPACKA
ncbi:MAG: DCC1-like thiol-disulfide oxidoreductase family protein [Actinomycetes bacterium]